MATTCHHLITRLPTEVTGNKRKEICNWGSGFLALTNIHTPYIYPHSLVPLHVDLHTHSLFAKWWKTPSEDSPSFHHQSVKTRRTEILTSRNYVANSGDSLAEEKRFITLCQSSSVITTDGVLRVGEICWNDLRLHFSRVLLDILVISSGRVVVIRKHVS